MHRRTLTGLVAVGVTLAVCVAAPLAVLAGVVTFDVGLTKSHSGNFTVGQNGTFTVTMSMAQIESGFSTIQGDTFSVTDTLPPGLGFVTAGGPGFSCSNTAGVVHCAGAPTMARSETKTITIVVSAGAAASPKVTNTATYADSFSADTNPDNNTATDVVTVNAAATSPSPTPTPSTSSSTSTRSTASAISAPPAGAGTGGTLWLLAGLAVALGAMLTAAGLRRRS